MGINGVSRWVVAGTALAVVMTGGFVAVAQADGDAVDSCVSKGALVAPKGAIRIVEGAQACRAYEYPLNWDQQGQPGPVGPAGPAGPQGPQGPQGDAAPKALHGEMVLHNNDWGADQLGLSFKPGSSIAWPARGATLAVPGLTQALIDGGATVDVAIQPYKDTLAWAPLPVHLIGAFGFDHRIDMRYSVGEIKLYYSYQKVSSGLFPDIWTEVFPDVSVRWVVRPG